MGRPPKLRRPAASPYELIAADAARRRKAESAPPAKRPSVVSWRNFIANLEHACAVGEANDTPRPSLYAAEIAVAAVVDLLRREGLDDGQAKLDRPLWHLLAALHDVEAGNAPEMFSRLLSDKPAPKDTLARSAFEQTAALAMQERMEAGEPEKVAAAFVARAVEVRAPELGISPRSGATLESMVRGWRTTQRKGDNLLAFERLKDTFRHMFAEQVGHPGTPAERAAVLEGMLRLRRPEF